MLVIGRIGTKRPEGRRLASMLARRSGASLWSLAAVVVLLVVFAVTAPGFYSQANWISVSLYGSEFLLLAIGQTFVIITAGIDLSDGAVLGFSAMAGALVMQTMLAGMGHSAGGLITAVGILVTLFTGALVGAINGVLITRLQVSPFIVTLGTLGMCTAAIDLLNNGQSISGLPPQVAAIGSYVIAGWVPIPLLVALVFTAALAVLLRRTRFGLRTYGIGSSERSAVRAGIDVRRHLVKVYTLSGLVSAVAGFMVMSRFAEASTSAGINDELSAIAAVVIGGASLFGGIGTIGGTLIGTSIIAMLVGGLVLAGVQPFWQSFAVGAFLIIAVAIERARERVAARR